MQAIHADLLRELGFSIPTEDIVLPPAPPPSPTLPTRPHHYDASGMAVFTSEQIAWAHPEEFGFEENYLVVEEEETSHPFALNYSDEINLPRKRPVHRYSRTERFRFILGQIMGCSGTVPGHVLKVFDREKLARLPDDQVWDEVRSTLKTHKWRLYYNRIPAILAGLGLCNFKYSDTKKFQDILYDFTQLDAVFESTKASLGRIYFPNLRFMAIKLMARHGIQPIFPIPKARTFRKLQSLEQVYEDLWKAVEKKKFEQFLEDIFQ